MPTLNLKPNRKAINVYYAALETYRRRGVTHETAVRAAFQALLETCARQLNWTLVCEYSLRVPENSVSGQGCPSYPDTGRRDLPVLTSSGLDSTHSLIRLDGALLDEYNLPRGTWEAKGIKGNLRAEIQTKFDAGYPQDNILFQTPERAILYQNGREVLDADITERETLVTVLETFFAYERENAAQWRAAVAKFRDTVPALRREAKELIQTRHRDSARFRTAFAEFHQLCQTAINPNLSETAVEEMLLQHLLTERTFRTVFDNPDFAQRNVIAREIEKVINALIEDAYSRDAFLENLKPFYREIEREAATLADFSQKQHFLNTVYEQFFQGDSAEVADTHGIVYTPQPIVDFMVKSVAHLLQTEFDRSLSEAGVHIIDPFVGTGNFIVRLMREIPPFHLEAKYRSELWCNEVLLLPYYIATLNIEHAFYEATQRYLPFEGISLVDTFELAEDRQLSLLTAENTARVEKQKAAPMFIVIGNPPYNAGQVNENDNNKNRAYPTMDALIRETYAKASTATLKNSLYDPYVKGILWASERIGEEGIVALVTNNSFLHGISFDGMRKHLAEEFDEIYLCDLGGNARTDKLVSGASVFGIQVGVSINFFVKRAAKGPFSTVARGPVPRDRDAEEPFSTVARGPVPRDRDMARDRPSPYGNGDNSARIFYFRTDDAWNKNQKFDFLAQTEHVGNVPWQTLKPDTRHTWLTGGLHAEFETFMPIGTQAAKRAKGEVIGAMFHNFSLGVSTTRDAWACNFNRDTLAENMRRMSDVYNEHVIKYRALEDKSSVDVDRFVDDDDKKIKWSSTLKRHLRRGRTVEFDASKRRQCLYRPFTKTWLFFDRVLTDRPGQLPIIFPTPETEKENRVICVKAPASNRPFHTLMVSVLPDVHLTGDSQCFPFYVYDEDGTNRRENITDWALQNFRAHYNDDTITKWDIFHYTYGLLHHPVYRERYAANLKRDLPHIPYADDFWAFADAGSKLAELHVNYERQPQYPLNFISEPGVPLDLRVERMQLSKDKTQLKYNASLTLDGIPAEALDYRLGQYSALEWLVNQYRVKTFDRSQIVNDANDAENPLYIVELIGSVITVSLETLKIIAGLPETLWGP